MKVSQLLPLFIVFSSFGNLSIEAARGSRVSGDVDSIGKIDETADFRALSERCEAKIDLETVERKAPDDEIHDKFNRLELLLQEERNDRNSSLELLLQEMRNDRNSSLELLQEVRNERNSSLELLQEMRNERNSSLELLQEMRNERNSSQNSWRSWFWELIDYKSLIALALGFALKYYYDQISHHRRDFTDVITISWHFFEDHKGKKKFFAPTEGKVSMQETFQDDTVLLTKVKLAVQTSFFPDYPPFVVLVGRRQTWVQVFRYIHYTVVTFVISVLFSVGYYAENILLCLVAGILHLFNWSKIDSVDGMRFLRWENDFVEYLFGNYFNTDPLYTPCRLDHTKLFLRRVITVVSEQTKNSLWSFEACKRSCNTSKENHHNPSKETVLVFAICEKDPQKSEVLQLKIVLIFKCDLLACLKPEYDPQKLEISYEPWIERVKNLRKLAEIYQKSVPNSPSAVQLQPTSSSSAPATAPATATKSDEFISDSNFKFWTEMELPGFPAFSHPVEVKSNSSSDPQETGSVKQVPAARTTSGTGTSCSSPSSLTKPRRSPRFVKNN
jgi:hypothetical protein